MYRRRAGGRDLSQTLLRLLRNAKRGDVTAFRDALGRQDRSRSGVIPARAFRSAMAELRLSLDYKEQESILDVYSDVHGGVQYETFLRDVFSEGEAGGVAVPRHGRPSARYGTPVATPVDRYQSRSVGQSPVVIPAPLRRSGRELLRALRSLTVHDVDALDRECQEFDRRRSGELSINDMDDAFQRARNGVLSFDMVQELAEAYPGRRRGAVDYRSMLADLRSMAGDGSGSEHGGAGGDADWGFLRKVANKVQAIVETAQHHGRARGMRDVFMRFDADRSGFLSRLEMEDALRELDIELRPPEVDALFRALDLNEDGRIDVREFRRLCEQGARALEDERGGRRRRPSGGAGGGWSTDDGRPPRGGGARGGAFGVGVHDGRQAGRRSHGVRAVAGAVLRAGGGRRRAEDVLRRLQSSLPARECTGPDAVDALLDAVPSGLSQRDAEALFSEVFDAHGQTDRRLGRVVPSSRIVAALTDAFEEELEGGGSPALGARHGARDPGGLWPPAQVATHIHAQRGRLARGLPALRTALEKLDRRAASVEALAEELEQWLVDNGVRESEARRVSAAAPLQRAGEGFDLGPLFAALRRAVTYGEGTAVEGQGGVERPGSGAPIVRPGGVYSYGEDIWAGSRHAHAPLVPGEVLEPPASREEFETLRRSIYALVLTRAGASSCLMAFADLDFERSGFLSFREIALAFRSLGFVVAEADAIGLLGSRPLRRGQRHRHPSPTEDRHGRTKSGRDHDKDRRRGGHDHGDRTDEEVGGHDAVIAFEEVSDEQLRASLGGQVDYHEALHTLIERARRHLALSGMSQGAEWSAGSFRPAPNSVGEWLYTTASEVERASFLRLIRLLREFEAETGLQPSRRATGSELFHGTGTGTPEVTLHLGSQLRCGVRFWIEQ